MNAPGGTTAVICDVDTTVHPSPALPAAPQSIEHGDLNGEFVVFVFVIVTVVPIGPWFGLNVNVLTAVSGETDCVIANGFGDDTDSPDAFTVTLPDVERFGTNTVNRREDTM